MEHLQGWWNMNIRWCHYKHWQMTNLTFPCWRARRDDRFGHLDHPIRSSDAKVMKITSSELDLFAGDSWLFSPRGRRTGSEGGFTRRSRRPAIRPHRGEARRERGWRTPVRDFLWRPGGDSSFVEGARCEGRDDSVRRDLHSIRRFVPLPRGFLLFLLEFMSGSFVGF